MDVLRCGSHFCMCVRLLQCRGELLNDHPYISSLGWLEGSNLVAGLGGHVSVWDAATRSCLASYR